MIMAEYPFKFEPVEDATFGGVPLVKAIPGNYMFMAPYAEDLPRLYNMELRPTDIWDLGVLKTGTTWLSELIWCVYHQADFTEAKSKYCLERWILAEMNGAIKGSKLGAVDISDNLADYFTRDTFETLKNQKTTRFIRTHIPMSMLHPKLLDTCKVIYIARNFKDTWVSIFHMMKGGTFKFGPKFEDLVEDYMNHKKISCPYPQHLREAYEKRHHKNMLFLLYEDMIKDLSSVVRKVAKFLEKDLSDEQVEKIVNHLSIDSMRKNKAVNFKDTAAVGWIAEGTEFIRKGAVGDWRNHFTPELLEKYNKWWDENMKGCDFKFPED